MTDSGEEHIHPVLVIDDDERLRVRLGAMLKDVGFAVTEAANGREALEAIRGGLHPCLILLDLTMPEMSGWEFLAQLQSDAQLALIPVLICTGYPITDTGHGEVGIMRKPFDLELVLRLVRRYC